MSTNDLLKAPEVGELLNVSGETVRRWAKEGRIAHVKLPSGKLRFRREDVDAALRTIEPTTPAA